MIPREELRQRIESTFTDARSEGWLHGKLVDRLFALIDSQGKPQCNHIYSRGINVPRPRPCVHCGELEPERPDTREVEKRAKMFTELCDPLNTELVTQAHLRQGYLAGDAARKEIMFAEMQGLIEIHHEQAKELEEELIETRLQLTSLKSVADKMAAALLMFSDTSAPEVEEALSAYETFCKENGTPKP